jgi:multiple antibiotic resistance protein
MVITSHAKIRVMAGLLEAFVLLLGIMDPLISLVAFLTLTKDMKREDRTMIAIKAVMVAAVVFLIFAIGGGPILRILGVQIESFKAAGGITLILLGIQMSLGITFQKEKDDISEVAVVIGTPMITGPATISTAIILGESYGVMTTVVAGSAALLVTLLTLIFSRNLDKLVGRSGIRIMSTMMGIITMAWGLQFLLIGINAFKP